MATATNVIKMRRVNRESAKAPPPALRSREAGLTVGKALRATLARERHGIWRRPANRRDPIDILKASNKGRLRELVPIRYGRMLRSPFTFLRGSAGLMASDLATTPTTNLLMQACGDCHLMNFDAFATPERNLVFDINDFDETLPAPWEWDLKRLAVSFVVAARNADHSDVCRLVTRPLSACAPTGSTCEPSRSPATNWAWK